MRRTFQLARVAAEAEVLRLRTMAKRYATRVVLAILAAVFLIATLVCAETAVAMAISRTLGPVSATLVVMGGNLLIAVIFLAIAASSKPSSVEREALQVRKTAQAQITQTMALTALIGPLARVIGGRKLYGLVLAALTARYLGARR